MGHPGDTATGGWTYSEYARLPDDGNRYEVLDGEVLVTPAPTPHHQRIVGRLFLGLVEYVEPKGHGWVLQDVDLLLAPGQFLRPDLVVVPSKDRAGVTDRGVERPPALAVEVVSPSSRTVDRQAKPGRYLDFGVPTCWVVDPFETVVWVWDRDTGPAKPRRLQKTLQWTFPEGARPLELEVAGLVAPL